MHYKLKFPDYISKKLRGNVVETRVTLKGIKAKYGRKITKRWKY